MNMNFGYFDDNGEFHYADDYAQIGDKIVTSPTAAHYAAMTPPRLPLVTDNQPTATGVTYTPNGWAYNAAKTAIERVWTATPIVAPTPVYSVEEVVYGLVNADAYDAVAAIVGNGLMALFLKRDTIASDNEIWQSKWPDLKAAIIAQGILTEDQIAAILKEAAVEEA